MPYCCNCQRDDLSRNAFSKAQFKKPAKERRCKTCAAASISCTPQTSAKMPSTSAENYPDSSNYSIQIVEMSSGSPSLETTDSLPPDYVSSYSTKEEQSTGILPPTDSHGNSLLEHPTPTEESPPEQPAVAAAEYPAQLNSVMSDSRDYVKSHSTEQQMQSHNLNICNGPDGKSLEELSSKSTEETLSEPYMTLAIIPTKDNTPFEVMAAPSDDVPLPSKEIHPPVDDDNAEITSTTLGDSLQHFIDAIENDGPVNDGNPKITTPNVEGVSQHLTTTVKSDGLGSKFNTDVLPPTPTNSYQHLTAAPVGDIPSSIDVKAKGLAATISPQHSTITTESNTPSRTEDAEVTVPALEDTSQLPTRTADTDLYLCNTTPDVASRDSEDTLQHLVATSVADLQVCNVDSKVTAPILEESVKELTIMVNTGLHVGEADSNVTVPVSKDVKPQSSITLDCDAPLGEADPEITALTLPVVDSQQHFGMTVASDLRMSDLDPEVTSSASEDLTQHSPTTLESDAPLGGADLEHTPPASRVKHQHLATTSQRHPPPSDADLEEKVQASDDAQQHSATTSQSDTSCSEVDLKGAAATLEESLEHLTVTAESDLPLSDLHTGVTSTHEHPAATLHVGAPTGEYSSVVLVTHEGTPQFPSVATMELIDNNKSSPTKVESAPVTECVEKARDKETIEMPATKTDDFSIRADLVIENNVSHGEDTITKNEEPKENVKAEHIHPFEHLKKLSDRVLKSPVQHHETMETMKKQQLNLIQSKLKELNLDDQEVEIEQQQEAQTKLVQQAMDASYSRLVLCPDKGAQSAHDERILETDNRSTGVLGRVGGWLSGSSHHQSDDKDESASSLRGDVTDPSKTSGNIVKHSSFFSTVGGLLSGSSHHRDNVNNSRNDLTKKDEIAPEEVLSSTVKAQRNQALRDKLKALLDESDDSHDLREKILELVSDDTKGIASQEITSRTRETLSQSALIEPISTEKTKAVLDLTIHSNSRALREILEKSKAARRGSVLTRSSTTNHAAVPNAVARDARRARTLQNMHRLDLLMEEAKKRRSIWQPPRNFSMPLPI